MINPGQNSRKRKRHSIQQEVVVRDSLTGLKLGQVANIHCEGFMLFGDEYVRENHLYQLQLELRQPVAGVAALSVGAECLWLNGSGDDSQCWAGFHIIDVSETDKSILNQLWENLQS